MQQTVMTSLLGMGYSIGDDIRALVNDQPDAAQRHEKSYVCDVCGKAFATNQNLKSHVRSHTGERPRACDHRGCGAAFVSSQHLVVHKRTHTGEKPYVCDVERCGKAFTQSGNLATHKRTHTGEKLYVCDVCGKRFSNNPTVHKRTHTGQRPYVCDVNGCGKTFARSEHLVMHKRTHTGEKPYVCDVDGCGKAFATSHSRRVHTRTHTGEKPYVCDVCGNAFARSEHLVMHKRTHTGEKPYVCDVEGCNKAFTTSAEHVQHKRIHTGERPYVCDVNGCGKAFAQLGTLVIHKRTHTGERPYVCDVDGCGRAFAQRSNLATHVKTWHNDTYVARRKIQEQRVCDALVSLGMAEWFHPEAMPPMGQFKREKRIDFSCVSADDTWCRIDFVVAVEGGYIFLEVDEHQHRFGYGAALSCDMKRMAKVMASLVVEAGDRVPRIVWLRYNPHEWRVDGQPRRVPKAERETWLAAFVRSTVCAEPLSIAYAYYDTTAGSPEVLQNSEYHTEFRSIARDVTPVGRP